MRRLVAIAVMLALAAGAGELGASTASADPASFGGATRHAVKRSGAAECAKKRRLAQRARATTAARRARRRACAPPRRAPAAAPAKPGAAPGRAPAGGAPVTVSPPARAPAAPVAPADPAAPAPAPATPVSSTLGVGAYDMGGFLLRLTRSSVPAGTLTVFFQNYDVSDHNLWIEGPSGAPERVSDAVGEGGGGWRTLPVTSGSWRLFCSLPEHEAMTRPLSVTP